MHELSLAQGLLDQLLALAEEHGAVRILTVSVEIGERAGIVVDSFDFGFNAVKTGHAMTCDACLEIRKTKGDELMLMQVELE